MNWKLYDDTQNKLGGVGLNFKHYLNQTSPNLSHEAQAVADATEKALDDLAKLVSQAMRSFVEYEEN